jgi:Na+-transporting methylmalonyl-CoA/oxaloacetate decarboxylase beta subunit
MPGPINLYPLNDLNLVVTLKFVDVDGSTKPLDTGPISFFIATSNLPTATAADPALSGTAVHLATGSGQWLIQLDASVLTYSLLNGLFASVPPVLIVQSTNNVRGYAPLTYVPSRPMTIQ